ncbi:MAG: S8 family serine peptidase [Planctomycetes bacterium]|nr:S8 family serine peptidase [Planctomycetota bacterium]
MDKYTVRYGGRDGKPHALAVSDDYVVVRTRSRARLDETALSARARREVGPLESMVRYHDAGVEVFRCVGTRKERATRRNRARSLLKQERAVQFAGRVLCEPRSRAPVVYTENFFIKFADDCAESTCRRVLRQHGLTIKRVVEFAANAFFAAAPDGTGLQVFAAATGLLQIESVELCHPELVRPARRRGAADEQWHLKRTTIDGATIDEHANVVSAWDLTQGAGITIAVIDDGFDIHHEEFDGSWKIHAPRDVTRASDDPRPGNEDHHGTACAAVACANGGHRASGVAPMARLMPVRNVSGLGSQSEADAFFWAAQNGADVISCSWGPVDGDWWDDRDPTHEQVTPIPDATRLAIDWAVEHGRGGRGCVVAWAAGNGNESVDNDGYASHEKVLAVAACNDRGTRSAYSDFGDAIWCCFPSDDGYVARTVGIWTADRTGAVGYNPGTTARGDASGDYTNGFGGTSAACPGVAGVAALILARNPDLRWDEVMDVIMNSCDQIDVDDGAYDDNGHSPFYGYGRVNARRAVDLAVAAPPRRTIIHTAVQEVPVRDFRMATLALEVGDRKPIDRVRVHVDVEHTFIGDLIVRLAPPAATGVSSIVLHDRTGAGRNNLKRTYDVASTPELADLTGVVPQGRWTLKVSDRGARNTGRIRRLSLAITS